LQTKANSWISRNKLKYYSSRKASFVIGLFVICAILSSLLITKYSSPTAQAAAGINEQLNYQARLLDSSGAVVADGTYNMEFKIYQDGTGCVSGGTPPCSGTLKWTETRTSTNKVTVKNGYFSVNLGSVTAFGTSVDWNQDTLWLSINIGGTGIPTWDGEMTPFRRLAAVPYAMNAKQLGGLDASQFVKLAPTAVQVDSGTLSSIFINKTGASGNILQLQKNGSDVLNIANNGAITTNYTSTSATAGTEYAFQINSSDTGAVTSGADDTRGLFVTSNRTGGSGTAVINNYGIYGLATSDTGGTSTAVGVAGVAASADSNYGVAGLALNTGSGQSEVDGIVGNIGSFAGFTGTTTTANAIKALVDISTAGTYTTASGLTIETATLSGGGAIGTNYGAWIKTQTVGATNYGLRVDTAAGAGTNQTVWIAGNDASATIASKGIAFGSAKDVTLYRGGANILQTDGDFYFNTGGTRTIGLVTSTTGAGNTLAILGATGLAAGPNAGGIVSITGGTGGSSTGLGLGGNGGAVNISGGATYSNNWQGSNGGAVNITGGTPTASVVATNATGGAITLSAGTGGAASGFASSAGGPGGAISISAGSGGAAGGGGNQTGGNGGALSFTAGSGGASIGSAANSSAGNITFTAGSAGTGGSGAAGTAGSINFVAASNGGINIGTNAVVATIQVGNATGATGTYINAGTSGLSLGNNGVANTIQIGNTTGAVAQSINIGNNASASSTNNVNIGSSIAGTTAITGPTTITNRTSGSSDTLVVSNSTSTGTIAKFVDGGSANPVMLIADGGAVTYQNQTNSTAAIQVKDSSTEVLFSIDTTARNASGGNLVKIGNSTGTDTATTILQVDSATANPTSNLSALNGGIFYNSTSNKMSIIENGTVKVLCNTTDAGCGSGGSTTLQSAYNATSGNTIVATDGRDLAFTFPDTTTDPNFTINLQCVTSCGSNGRFAVQSAGTDVFTIAPSGTITATKHIAIGSSGSVQTGTVLYNQETYTGTSSFKGQENQIYINSSVNSGGISIAADNNLTLQGSGISYTSSNYGTAGTVNIDATGSSTNTVIGVQGVSNNRGTGTITNAYGSIGVVYNTSTGTITNAFGIGGGIANTTTGTIGTAYNLYIGSTTNAGTITDNYGGYFATQTSGSNNYGVRIDTASTQTLLISGNADSTTSTAGIAFGQTLGTRANIYRSANNTLKTDSNFIVDQDATINSQLSVGATSSITLNTIINATDSNVNTTGQYYGQRLILTANPTGSSSADGFANYSSLTTSGSNNLTGTNSGMFSRVDHGGSGILSNAYGTWGYVGTTSGAITTANGLFGQVDNNSSSSITTARGVYGYVNKASSGDVVTASALAALVNNGNASGSITNAYGINVSPATNSGTITTNTGIWVQSQTAGTSNYGVRIDTASTQTLWISGNADSTDASAGIAFGTSKDTNLYRDAANSLKTDDKFTAAGLVTTAANTVQFNDSDNSNYVALKAASTVSSNVTWTLPSADSAGCLQSNGSGTLSIAACGDTNIQTFSSSGDYTVPTNALMVIIEGWGGGGGGGGGTGGTTAAVRSGGAGGGGGGYNSTIITASTLGTAGTVVKVTVGAGGTGGTAGNGAVGGDGGAGGTTCFSTTTSCAGTMYFRVFGGGGGNGDGTAGNGGGGGGGSLSVGTTNGTAATGGAGGSPLGASAGAQNSGYGGAGGATAAATGAAGGSSGYGGAGGGSSSSTGGGNSGAGGGSAQGGAAGGAGATCAITTCTQRSGGAGGSVPNTSGGGGTAGTTAGQAGGNGAAGVGSGGDGGGGGANNAAGTGGAGGTGGTRGGGGGGGGAGETTLGGAGGAGGGGYLRTWTLRGAGADLAEMYNTYDDDMIAGDVVAIDGSLQSGVKKTERGYDPNTIGVISTRPGLILGDETNGQGAKTVMVALAGRVPVKVSLENGPITVGDPLTPSSTPGVAMKATKYGPIIGNAMTTYNGDGPGYVVVFIKNSHTNGSKLSDALQSTSAKYQDPSKTLAQNALTFFSEEGKVKTDSTNISEVYTDRVTAALEIISPQVTTNNLATDTITSTTGKDVSVNLQQSGKIAINDNNKEEVASIDDKGNATFKGTITADKIRANQIEGLEVLTNQLSSLAEAEQTANQSSNGTTTQPSNSQASPVNIKDISATTAIFTSDVTANGTLFANGALKVAGPAEFLGDSIFYKLATFIDRTVFKNNVEFAAPAAFGDKIIVTNNTAGTVKIPVGETKIVVQFSKPYSTPPVINATPIGIIAPKYGVTNITKNGFEIDIDPAQPTETQFNWFAVEAQP